jgi:hypothetical protein
VAVVVEVLAQGQGYFRDVPLFPVIIVPPVSCTHLHLNVALTRRTYEAWDPSKTNVLSEIDSGGQEIIFIGPRKG